MKERNKIGGTCIRCHLFVATGNGWAVKTTGVGYQFYHNSCYNSKVEQDKAKLKHAFDKINSDKEQN
jgi:hypothetical protein